MIRSEINVGGLSVPVFTANTVIVGAGAAGMGCAVYLHDFLTQAGVKDAQERIVIVTRGKELGASRQAGSDKQTYYKMGTSPRVPDTAQDFAKTLTAAGCMHGDLALAEANCSLRQFYRLVAAGVPFPHDPEGAFLGYKTDHDPYERATSAGPRTSRFMSACLEAEAKRAGIPIMDKHELLDFLVTEEDGRKRLVGILTLDTARLNEDSLGLTVFQAENLVLAAGGPGEIYQTTVYPEGQVGIHGIALKAGLRANNLTESQYGLAAIKFRWNVSGSYMQVAPRIFSTAADGTSEEREFLTDYFPTMERMATCIFLKGYQWPFDAQRIDNHQSSLIDMAVHRETVTRGRRVFMDFLQNPLGSAEMNEFALAHLEEEARTYLERTGATQARPIERLAHMNQPAIDIFSENGIDLWREPLEIAVCAQHLNGGFCVDKWWQSNIPHTFIIGEMAGTHGIKRPGGSALNSGQVGAVRAAEYIAQAYGAEMPPDRAAADFICEQIKANLSRLRGILGNGDAAAPPPRETLAEIRCRMTREGAHIRSKQTIAAALAEALAQYRFLQGSGLKAANPAELIAAIQAESMCLAQVAFLGAIENMIARGAGSRGSHIILDAEGLPMPEVLRDDAGELPRWRPENEALRQTIQELQFAPGKDTLLAIEHVPVRPMPARDIAFEPAWTAFRNKLIFKE